MLGGDWCSASVLILPTTAQRIVRIKSLICANVLLNIGVGNSTQAAAAGTAAVLSTDQPQPTNPNEEAVAEH